MLVTQWDDYRVAFQVAESGSLTAAAKQLGCNHATVLRHVNRLEESLNIKLFIRHQRGYRLTDAGQIMVNEMPDIYKEFRRMEDLMGSVDQGLIGNLKVTTPVDFSALLNPALMAFRETYPKLRIQLISSDEVIPLSGGLVHVSIRAGQQPTDADLIVKKILAVERGYYAASHYVDKRGLPRDETEYDDHDWVMPSVVKQHIPIIKDMMQKIDHKCVVYQSNHIPDVYRAVVDGMGIGVLPIEEAEKRGDMHRLHVETSFKGRDTLWFIYHRDLKNDLKVKTLYRHLMDSIKD